MSAIPAMTFTITFPRDPRLYTRDHNRHIREANKQAAKIHHQRHVPRHFEAFAPAKYGYFKRSKKYEVRKFKQVGHNRPLEFTGISKRHILRFTDDMVKATPKGSTLTVKLQIKGGSGRVIDAAAAARLFAAGKRKTATISKQQIQSQKEILRRVAEMGAISPDERQYIGDRIGVIYAQLANAPGQVYRVKIKAG